MVDVKSVLSSLFLIRIFAEFLCHLLPHTSPEIEVIHIFAKFPNISVGSINDQGYCHQFIGAL